MFLAFGSDIKAQQAIQYDSTLWNPQLLKASFKTKLFAHKNDKGRLLVVADRREVGRFFMGCQPHCFPHFTFQKCS